MVWWFEVETRYWVVRLHAAPWFFGTRGVWLVLPASCAVVCGVGCGVGLFLENCIVDASIL